MDCEGDELGVDEGEGDPGVGDQGVVGTCYIRQVLEQVLSTVQTNGKIAHFKLALYFRMID